VVLVNANSTEETAIEQKRQSTEELLRAVSANVPVKVIVLVPAIEVVFFWTPRVLQKISSEKKITKEVLLLGKSNPKEALAQLSPLVGRPPNLDTFLAALDEEDVEALRATLPICELIRFLREIVFGVELWKRGRMELRPGIGMAGQCREVVIDLEKKAILKDRKYPGTVENPESLPNGQVEITWAEGGGMRIIQGASGLANGRPWRWSQPRAVWEEGGCPPDYILQAILVAMEK
jgi:hypothetical protein